MFVFCFLYIATIPSLTKLCRNESNVNIVTRWQLMMWCLDIPYDAKFMQIPDELKMIVLAITFLYRVST